MSPSRKRYSREFKLEVIRRVQETGRRQALVAIPAFMPFKPNAMM